MKITFVYLASESLAIEYLASALKAHGHQTHLSFDPGLFADKQYLEVPFLAEIFDAKNRVINDIVSSNPGLVAFSAGTDNYLWAKVIARAVKERISVPIIFGGIHPTALPDKVLANDFVDMVCIGEGERAIVELADTLEKKEDNRNIKNIWFKKNGSIIKNELGDLIEDLDTLPFPDKSLFEKEILIKNGKYMIMTSRGCPYRCTYCYNDVLKSIYAGKGRYVRQRSIKNVLDELVLMKERYRYASVAFMDDLFIGNRNWFKEFSKQYKKLIAAPFSCMTSTNLIDEESARLLKESGCIRMQFGIQTMNPKTREDTLKRGFEKTEDIHTAIRACEKFGISYSIDHIFGIPGEGEADYISTAEFYSLTNTDRICCYALSYYPKTSIIDAAKQQRILDDREIEAIEEGMGRLYIYGSSLQGSGLKLFKGMRKYYSLLPLMPYPFRKYIIRKKLYKYFRFIPRFITLFFEAVVSLKTGHPRGNDYIRYYIHHILTR